MSLFGHLVAMHQRPDSARGNVNFQPHPSQQWVAFLQLTTATLHSARRIKSAQLLGATTSTAFTTLDKASENSLLFATHTLEVCIFFSQRGWFIAALNHLNIQCQLGQQMMANVVKACMQIVATNSQGKIDMGRATMQVHRFMCWISTKQVWQMIC